jgi:hypothetical protein
MSGSKMGSITGLTEEERKEQAEKEAAAVSEECGLGCVWGGGGLRGGVHYGAA